MTEKLWLEDPKVLFTKYTDIYPRSDNNNFNAIARYFLLMSIIFSLFSRYKWVYICIIGFIIITIIGYLYFKETKKNDQINIINKYKSCRHSTINNPMANLLPLDPNPELEACKSEENDNNNLYFNFYEDENDINAKKN